MFLNPFLLFGALAIASPILIHLLNKRRIERVKWAAMRFLSEAVEQNQRKINLEDLLLLLMRCALIVLLAIALARPALQAAGAIGLRERVTAYFVLDNSGSMSQTDGTESRFEQAKRVAGDTISTFPQGSSVALYLGSDTVEPIISEPTFDTNLARSTISKLELSSRGSDLLPAIQKAVDSLQTQGTGRKELYVLTDGQANAFRDMPSIVKLLTSQKDQVHANIVLIGEMEQHNLGVSSLRLASPLAIVDRPLRFEAQVTNYGVQEVKQVNVQLSVDGAPASDEALIESIAPGATQNVSLFGRLRGEGYHTLTAHVPSDRMPTDDSRSLVVRAIKQVQVLVVDGNPGREERDNETFYLRQALQPVDPLYRDQFFIQVKGITPTELESARLDQFDVVFLANVPDFSNRTLSNFKAFLRQGGGLIIFPGASTDYAAYNNNMVKHNGFLPATLGEPVGDPANTTAGKTLQASKYNHPIVSIWNDPGSGLLSTAHFYKVFPLTPAPEKLAGDAVGAADAVKTTDAGPPQIVLRYSDGTPAVMERPWSLGRVILFSSTVSTAWNDLAVRPAFIPLLHRVVGSVLSRQDDLLNIRVGSRFLFYPPAEMTGQQAHVTPPPKDGKAAEGEPVAVQLSDERATLTFDHTSRAGIYSVTSPTNDPLVKFTTNQDPAESQMESVPAPALDSLKAVASVTSWKPGTTLDQKQVVQHSGTEFWLPIIIACILLAAAESFLAQRSGESR